MARWRTASAASDSAARPVMVNRVLRFSVRIDACAQVWLLLEFCDHGTLADGIDRGLFRREPSNVTGAPDFARIMAAAADVAAGLAYLHQHSVLHGDITGGNVLLKSTGAGPQAFKV